MKTSEVTNLVHEFLSEGQKWAEMTFERHLEGYCKRGEPFLSCFPGQGETLQSYANQAMQVYCIERFEGYSAAEIQELQSINMNLIMTVFTDIFCRRYCELLPLQEDV